MTTQEIGNLPLDNRTSASRLERIAELLEAQNANPFRVRAYRQAADTLRSLHLQASDILQDQGAAGLTKLPGIGDSLARALEQLVTTGKTALLTQLEDSTDPASVLETVPGIGPKLAARIHEQLGIATLFDLEQAAYDGRLAEVPGFGMDRLRAVRESLAGRLHRRAPVVVNARQPKAGQGEPPVADLLDIDGEYRCKAGQDRLPRIAPKRFNPENKAWLAVLNTTRNGVGYTALFSNTQRAHEMNATNDWVVIYREDSAGAGQWTVVTMRTGPLAGQRAVRGREAECLAYYTEQARRREAEPKQETLPLAV